MTDVRQKYLPETGQEFYYCSPNGEEVYNMIMNDSVYGFVTFSNSKSCERLIKENNCFRNEKEAKERGRILKIFKETTFNPNIEVVYNTTDLKPITFFLVYNDKKKEFQFWTEEKIFLESTTAKGYTTFIILHFRNVNDFNKFRTNITAVDYAYYMLGL